MVQLRCLPRHATGRNRPPAKACELVGPAAVLQEARHCSRSDCVPHSITGSTGWQGQGSSLLLVQAAAEMQFWSLHC